MNVAGQTTGQEPDVILVSVSLGCSTWMHVMLMKKFSGNNNAETEVSLALKDQEMIDDIGYFYNLKNQVMTDDVGYFYSLKDQEMTDDV